MWRDGGCYPYKAFKSKGSKHTNEDITYIGEMDFDVTTYLGTFGNCP